MIESSKNILLVCYGFPPNPGIGGRRWSKLAIELANKGYTIHVINAKLPIKEKSVWTYDVNLENIIIHSIQMNYPNAMNIQPNSFYTKVKYALTLKYLQYKTKGTLYDKTILAEKKFAKKATELISKFNINNLIVTGSPFNLIYYSAKLKSNFSHLNIIADYRDPWINSISYGMNQLNKKRKQEEKRKQQLVLENCNYITAPNKYMLDEIPSFALEKNKIKAKFEVLSHFYDSQLPSYSLSKKTTTALKLKIIYGGALYVDTKKTLENFAKSLTEFENKKESTITPNKIKIDFFVRDKKLGEKIFATNSNVEIHSTIGNLIFDEIAKADLLIILLAEHNKDFRTTKFVEYLPFQKSILYIGPQGGVSSFIAKHNLGYTFIGGKADWKTLLNDFQNNKLIKNIDFDHTQYSIKKLTNKLEGFLS